MLNFFTWGKNAHQIVLEGTSFYFSYKMPVALRARSDPNIYVPDKKFGKDTMDFVNALSITGKIKPVPEDDFKPMMKTAYNKSIMTGAERIARERLCPCPKPKTKKKTNDA